MHDRKHNKQGESMSKIDAKVAFPSNDGVSVEEHFGHCRNFVICSISNGKLVETESLSPPEHVPGAFPKFLNQQGATAIITGGMGQRAVDLFKAQNIDVILGATGDIKLLLDVYLNGSLYSKGSSCSHNHGEGEHDCHN